MFGNISCCPFSKTWKLRSLGFQKPGFDIKAGQLKCGKKHKAIRRVHALGSNRYRLRVEVNRQGNSIVDNPFADDSIRLLNEWLNDKVTILNFKSRIEELLVMQNYTGAFVTEINEVYETLSCLDK